MKEKIESFMELYKYSPTLVLYEPLLDTIEEKEAISTIFKMSAKERLNPVDVILESLVNVISEDISRREVTHSKDKVLMNNTIRKMAVEKILRYIGNDRRKLKKLHQQWLHMLVAFLNQLHPKNLKIDEVIFLVGSRFRISGQSAIKAIASICQ